MKKMRTSYHQMSNGMTEIFNRSLMNMLGNLENKTRLEKEYPFFRSFIQLHKTWQYWLFPHLNWCLEGNLDWPVDSYSDYHKNTRKWNNIANIIKEWNKRNIRISKEYNRIFRHKKRGKNGIVWKVTWENVKFESNVLFVANRKLHYMRKQIFWHWKLNILEFLKYSVISISTKEISSQFRTLRGS